VGQAAAASRVPSKRAIKPFPNDATRMDKLNVISRGERAGEMAAQTALEWIEGGGLSFTVPAAMLDPSVPMSSVLSARTWQEHLSADERASLRRFLPDPTASEEDVSALLAALFGDGDTRSGDTPHVNMHFGNPAERVWREIQARERDPEVMAHRNAIGVVERGAHELEVRLHRARVARAGMGMLRKFRDADADAAGGDGGGDGGAGGGGGGGGVTREDRLRAWRQRDATPEPDRSRRGGSDDDEDAPASNDETSAKDGGKRANRRDEVAASEEAARRAMRVAMEAADAASKLAATSGGPGAMAALKAAETAMAAAEAAAAEARRARTRWIEGGGGSAGGGGARGATGGNSAEKKPKVANPHSMRVDGPVGLNRKFSTNEDW